MGQRLHTIIIPFLRRRNKGWKPSVCEGEDNASHSSKKVFNVEGGWGGTPPNIDFTG